VPRIASWLGRIISVDNSRFGFGQGAGNFSSPRAGRLGLPLEAGRDSAALPLVLEGPEMGKQHMAPRAASAWTDPLQGSRNTLARHGKRVRYYGSKPLSRRRVRQPNGE